MKATGIVRKIDELGRIVLPIELRRILGISASDGVEIYVEEDRIILRKHEQACLFCGSKENLVDYKEKCVCKACIEEMNK